MNAPASACHSVGTTLPIAPSDSFDLSWDDSFLGNDALTACTRLLEHHPRAI